MHEPPTSACRLRFNAAGIHFGATLPPQGNHWGSTIERSLACAFCDDLSELDAVVFGHTLPSQWRSRSMSLDVSVPT